MNHLRTLWKITLPIIIAFTGLLAFTQIIQVRAAVTNVSTASAPQGQTVTAASAIAAPPSLLSAAAAPTANQVAYWDFEDAANPTADNSGYGNDAALSGGYSFSSDVPVFITGANSLDLDGTDGEGSTAGINVANSSFTIAFWARHDTTVSDDWAVSQGSGSTNNGLQIGFRGGGAFSCAFWGNDLDTPSTYADSRWRHWTCTYDAATNERAIFLDGQFVISDTAAADYQGSGVLYLGGRHFGGTNYFDGALDDVYI